MPSHFSTKYPRGLDLQSNTLVAATGKDAGGSGRAATTIADNCVLSRQRTIGNRRGFRYYHQPTSAQIDFISEYQTQLIEHQSDQTLWHADSESGVRTQYSGSYPPPAGVRNDAAIASGSFFITTSSGIQKLDSATGTPSRAGMPKGLETRVTIVTNATGFLQANYRCGYHVTWLRKDATGQEIRGDVSTRVIATNTGTAANVTLAFTVPADVTTSDWFEVWRTVQVAVANPDPGDTCYLVAKTLNTFAPLATASFTDTVPDNLLTSGLPLYTNPTQSGSLAGAARPPFSKCVETYKDYLFFANCAIDATLPMNLLASINLVANTSKLVISDATGSRTYVASTAEDVPTQKWLISTASGSNAANIEATTRSLCHVISGDPSGRWYAEYSSGVADNPGLFRVWARSPVSSSFWLTASDTTTGNQFSPVLPTSGQSVSGSNDYRANRIFWSQPSQPEAVPILNYTDCGRRDAPILKLVSCRDCLFVIKADGIWTFSGLSAPFAPIELDSTCRCVAGETAVMLNNQVVMLSNQGVVKVSLSGVTVVSYDIEPAIMVTTIRRPNLQAVAFGVAHEADRSYYLWLPQADSDVVAPICYVYQVFAEEWTRWTKPGAYGYVHTGNFMLFLSSGLENALLRQRKLGDSSDFSDEELPITLTNVTGMTFKVTWPNTVYQPVVGMTVHQGGDLCKVLAVSGSGTARTFTVDRPVAFVTGAATVRLPIACHVQLSPQNLGETAVVKTFYSVTYMLEVGGVVTTAAIEAATNEAPQMNSYQMTRSTSGGWGLSAWGLTPYGDTVNPAKIVPWKIDLPVPHTTGETLTSGWFHSVSTEQFIISQIGIEYDTTGDYVSIMP